MLARLLPCLAAAALAASHASAPSEWDWAAPLPHRQTWIDLASGPNSFVGITDGYGGRQIYSSTNASQWDLIQIPIRAGLRRIVFANGNYLAVGAQDTIMSSPDGIDWQVRHTNPLGGVFFDITYGNGAYVAIGYNSSALVSKDLKSWFPVNFPGGYSLLTVQFGNGNFVAVANSGLIYRSSDGRAWTSSPWPSALGSGDPALFEAGLAFNNGHFVLSLPGGTATSADGSDWTVASSNFFPKIVATDQGFAAASGNNLSVSTDGATWRTVFSSPESRAQFNAIAQSSGQWIAAGKEGLLYKSDDGATWESQIKPIDYSHSKIAFANGTFIRFGADDGQYLSADGRTWIFNTNAPALNSLASGNNLIVGITDSGSAAVSTDLTNWDEIPLPANPTGDILFGNGIFLAAANGVILTSTDGKSWTATTIPNVASIRLIGFQNGLFAALSNTAQPMTSSDGKTWTVNPAQPDIAAQFYAAGNGRFIGIGGGGMGPGFITWSNDGAHWQRQRLDSGSSYSYTGLFSGGGYFLMTDDNGGIFYSTNGIEWSGERQAPQSWTSAAFGNGLWIALGGDSVLRSTDPMAASSAAILQLTQSNQSTWTLTLTASPGASCQIETAASLNAAWLPFQTIQMPATGQIEIPISTPQPAAFFRANLQP